ncbi:MULTISPECIES: ABC transporter permease [Mesorhizobium]|uniref:ABC transporter permease n=4 Tax=Mesorhizobium TaxID=68287 RepID=A0A1A5HMX2_RHILI|nr:MULTISPECIES: ABC transporter permease [Mesorhizobium]ETA71421.1 ABC-type nitrate/sulfonate/bicarbonate transport system, permease component [Mesorhizobium japonicum R7A]MBE1708254.1 ABC transporter permease [Mesorhizobium japonicum]MBE1713423.1 ABC transporter permease [Mesorhizobium japonicum]MUT25462.1 ABC transporter permease subunit [Mesorhizobium japonicum]MUT31572.1 ABC transporter permease subunit [Mesorhizobium japonicum]
MSDQPITNLSESRPESRFASSWGAATGSWLPAVILLLVTIVVWEAVVRIFAISAFIIPAPSEIAQSLVAQWGTLMQATLVTAGEILFGFLVSVVVGIAIALVIVRFDWLGRALYPLVVLFQNVPKVALAPIFILWFGYGLAPKIGLILVIAFFPVTLSMLAGMQSVDRSLLSLMNSVGASRTQILFRIRVPHSLPNLMAGTKIAATLSVIGAIVGEFAGASDGLGYVIQFASTQLDTALVFAALLLVSVLGIAFYYAAEILERIVVPWAPKFSQS